MLLGFFLLLGFPKWASTFSPLSIWSVHAVHMWIKDFPALSVFSSFFLCGLFRTMDHNLYICIYFSRHEQCCLFEFPSLAVILKCSHRFINFNPHIMANPSYPFIPVLMTLVFKRKSFRTPNTNVFSLSNTNTFSISLSSLCSPSQTLSSVYSDQPMHHDASERPKLFPP